jgi:hypothetical protein
VGRDQIGLKRQSAPWTMSNDKTVISSRSISVKISGGFGVSSLIIAYCISPSLSLTFIVGFLLQSDGISFSFYLFKMKLGVMAV